MSELRRLRSETKQGLHQFLMRLYTSYLETMSETEAKETIQEILKEQYDFFGTGDLSTHSTKEALTVLKEELTNKMESSKGFDEQMWYAEKVDALQVTIETLDMPTIK